MSSNNIPLKFSRGYKDKLPATIEDGMIYYCIDSNELFFDYVNNSTTPPIEHRYCLNPMVGETDYGDPVGKGLVSPEDKEIIDTAVRFVEQHLEPEQQKQARLNINAVGEKTLEGGEIFNDYENNIAFSHAHTEGQMNAATGENSHAEGHNTTAAGLSAHSEGEGLGYTTLSSAATAGSNTFTVNNLDNFEIGQHITLNDEIKKITAINRSTMTVTVDSNFTKYTPEGAFVYLSGAIGDYSHSEGYKTLATGNSSHAEGSYTEATNSGAHAEGFGTVASGSLSHAEGYFTTSSGQYGHTEGWNTQISSNTLAGHAEGYWTKVLASYGHAEGNNTEVSYDSAHAEGSASKAKGEASHAEGSHTEAIGHYSHAEGGYTKAVKNYSHAEGQGTEAQGDAAHAEGWESIASGNYSHAGGLGSQAQGESSYARGYESIASGNNSFAHGYMVQAIGYASHAEGEVTIASGESQHVQGKYNIEDTENKYAHIVGNGTSSTPSNAHTLDWEGNAWFAGNIRIGGTSYETGEEPGVKPYMTKVILTTTNWDPTALTQVATIKGIKADETAQAIYINPVFDDTMIDEIGNCNVYASAQGENSITFSCDSIPTIDVEFYVKWQDVKWIKPILPPPNLIDFEYDYDEANDTYILTSWKETTNGVMGTEIIIPNDERIIV